MSKPLPARPDPEQLRKQAKDLLKSHRSGNAEALRRFQEHHPDFSQATVPELPVAAITLADAQLVLGYLDPEYYLGRRMKLEMLERHAFYERARKCVAVVAMGEGRPYGNIILTKGVIAST